MTIVEFLRARLDEDEHVARAAEGHPVEALVSDDGYTHLTRWSVARVLADVEAKRRIIEALGTAERNVAEVRRTATDYQFVREAEAAHDALLHAVRLLALPSAYHPDYRQEWAP